MNDGNQLPEEPQSHPNGHEEEYDVPTPSERVIAVIINPREAFRFLYASRPWPLFLVCVAAAVVIFTGFATVMSTNEDYQRYQAKQIDEQIEKIRENTSIPKSDRKNVIAEMEKQKNADPTIGESVGGSLLVFTFLIPILIFIIAGIVLILMKILERGEETRVRYTDALGVVALSFIVLGIGLLTTILMGALLHNPALDIGLGDLISTKSTYLAVLFDVISLAFLWWFAILIVGMKEVTDASLMKTGIVFGSTVFLFILVIGTVWLFVSPFIGGPAV
jgi:hypothetical protein